MLNLKNRTNCVSFKEILPHAESPKNTQSEKCFVIRNKKNV